MRLTIIFLFLIAIGGTILFLSKRYEIREEQRETDDFLAWQQKQDLLQAQEIWFQQEIIKPLFENPMIDSVDLSNFELRKLPEGLLDTLKHLKYLNLSNNKFSQLPTQCFTHPTLEVLEASNNMVRSISPAVFESNLKQLFLNENHLRNLPNLNYFPQLEVLNISNNFINTRIFFDEMQNETLRYLDLSHNSIIGIEGVHKLSNLEVLITNDNNMAGVPDFSLNEKLTYLDISDNHILNFTFIKDSSTVLNLKTVKANNNRIQSLRNKSTLVNLKHLELEGNRIAELENIKVIYPNLTYLNVKNNSLFSKTSINEAKEKIDTFLFE